MANEQELADMERMSNNYVPDIQGPLVGKQQSTQALVAEYAQADPIYVNKTRALPSKFSHYRTVRGDGNCGWRALAFGYFECLLRLGDPAKVRSEITRLKDCNGLLDAVGFEPFVYEDSVAETFELLEQIAATLPNHDGGAGLLAKFNDENGPWAQITFHFRILTSAWLKLNPELFSDFLVDMDVTTYCERTLEPFAVELDHIGLQGLAFAVINTAGLSIEILYLDRSEGEEVNTHVLPVMNEGKVVEGTPTIRLLYRPGHYDLLYRSSDITEMAIGALANPEVRRVANPVMELPVYEPQYDPSGGDFGILADIPGYTLGATPFEPFGSTNSFANGSEPPPIVETKTVPSPTSDIRTALAHADISPPTGNGLRVPSNSPTSDKAVDDKFRSSEAQLKFNEARSIIIIEQSKAGFSERNPDLSKQEDPAHFSNKSFQPQQWKPGPEYDGEPAGRSS